MSEDKEIRDEAFRQWKRDLIAREPVPGSMPVDAKTARIVALKRGRRWIVPQSPEPQSPWWESREARREVDAAESRKYWEGADIEAREREAIEETMKDFKESLKFLKDYHDQADGHGNCSYE